MFKKLFESLDEFCSCSPFSRSLCSFCSDPVQSENLISAWRLSSGLCYPILLRVAVFSKHELHLFMFLLEVGFARRECFASLSSGMVSFPGAGAI